MSRAVVRTLRADGTKPRYLGQLGPVTGLRYSWTLPGGPAQMQCNLGIPVTERTDAMDPGRITEILLGGSVIWDGKLDEPQPGDGWAITAHGSGTYGADYLADYDGKWATDAPDTVINDAVSRGMPWLPSSVGHPAGMFLGSPPDSGDADISGMLDQLCSLGGLTWQVRRTPDGPGLSVFPLPTAANRLLVCTAPAGRTLGGDTNAIRIRYCSAPDLGDGYPALFRTTWAVDQDSVDAHGRMETFMDLSDAGAMPQSDAQAIGNQVLARYQRALFAGPFTAQPGQLLTLGGTPCDLGVYDAGDTGPMVVRLILADEGWGGEVTAGPVTFAVGEYEVDDDTGTAAITPFASVRSDFAGLLAARAGQAHGHPYYRYPVPGGGVAWRFKGTSTWHVRHRPGRRKSRPPHTRPKRIRGV